MKNIHYILFVALVAHTTMYGAATSSTSSSSSGTSSGVERPMKSSSITQKLSRQFYKDIRKADSATIKNLLDKGANVFQKIVLSENVITTPFEEAIDCHVKPEIFKLLLQSLKDQNLINTEKNRLGMTYLSFASLRAVTANRLLEACPTRIDKSCNSIAILRLLLDFGADTNISDDNGENAFLRAHRYPTVLQVFTDYETRRKDMLNASDAGNRLSPPGICTLILSYGTAVSRASSSSSSSSNSSSHPTSTVIPSVKIALHPNPLYNAFLMGNQTTIKELLEAGEDPASPVDTESTVLHSVCSLWIEFSYSTLELLLRYLTPYHRINVIRNSKGETPLITAVRCAVATQKLSAKHIMIGPAPVTCALLYSRAEMESAKNNRDQLHVNKITLLLSCGADPHVADNDGHDALYYANQCPAVLKIFTDYETQQKTAGSSSSSSSSSTR